MSERRADDDPPPVLGTWNRVYVGVAIYLAALICAFWVFTRGFAP
ncbi:MAG: hypothetical protein R2729_11355 [Bryobacteraceae bacterium]